MEFIFKFSNTCSTYRCIFILFYFSIHVWPSIWRKAISWLLVFLFFNKKVSFKTCWTLCHLYISFGFSKSMYLSSICISIIVNYIYLVSTSKINSVQPFKIYLNVYYLFRERSYCFELLVAFHINYFIFYNNDKFKKSVMPVPSNLLLLGHIFIKCTMYMYCTFIFSLYKS